MAKKSLASIPILPILNSVALLGALGFLYYSKMVFKKPVITEELERARLESIHKTTSTNLVPGLVDFEVMTVNIASTPENPGSADGTSRQINGKLHYITVGFSLRIQDKEQQEAINELRPKILDFVISVLGKKKFHELTTAQGRYTLRSQILEAANRLAANPHSAPGSGNPISDVYFSQFIVQ